MPQLRTDIIDVYVFRRPLVPGSRASQLATALSASQPATALSASPAIGAQVEFLQLRRSKGALSATWQTVMGHAHPGETAVQTAVRELKEETGFAPPALLNLWQLEEVNTYFLASHDAIVMSPCFAAEVAPGSEPALNDEHDAYRWVKRDHADRHFVWPGQRTAIAGICRDILAADSPLRAVLSVASEPGA